MKRYLILVVAAFMMLAPALCLANGGDLRDASNASLGRIDNDGSVRNASNASIGRAQGVKKEWAAVFYFFKLF